MKRVDMTSCQPYILRAIYQWIVDNGLTPFITVGEDELPPDVAEKYAEGGVVTLNISPRAVRDLQITDERFCFKTRFAGRETGISVPIDAVNAIYAKEAPDDTTVISPPLRSPSQPQTKPAKKTKPHLRIVE